MKKKVATLSCPICNGAHMAMVLEEIDDPKPGVLGMARCARFGTGFEYSAQYYPKVSDFVPEFSKELAKQLISDEARWEHTWLFRTREGQEKRIMDEYNKYYQEYLEKGVPIPWLKIAGNAVIAWVRDKYPYLFPME